MAEAWLPLGRFIGKLDFSGTGPPWPLLVWNPASGTWESVGVAPTALQKLSDVIVPTGGQPTITFDPIAAGFASLRLQLVGAADTGTSFFDLLATFNGDTDISHYETHAWYTDSAHNVGENTYTSPTVGGGLGALTTPGAIKPSVPSVLVGELPGYDSTVFSKMVHINQGLSLDYAAYAQVIMKLIWDSLSPITSIILQPKSGNFIAGTRAVLYGIT